MPLLIKPVSVIAIADPAVIPASNVRHPRCVLYNSRS